ncbi:kinase-like protein [Clavulina sp. PMI_390]|nr:kinase-like protein [Clavulina sp. PMI_390]
MVLPTLRLRGSKSGLDPKVASSKKSKDEAPNIPAPMLERLQMNDTQFNISELPPNAQTNLLDQIYNDLQTRSHSQERCAALRCLQDFCYYFNSLPSSFNLDKVTFLRSELIGRGGEAAIYRGDRLGKSVVVRETVLTQRQRTEPIGKEIARLVRREAITHSQLHHNNILEFLGIFQERSDSPPLTVLPYIERGSLQDLLTSGEELDADRFQSILGGTNKGIAYLHSREPPVIHGDLHPGNILLGENSNPLLCDFGLSRIRHEMTRTRTQAQAGGKTRYLAPELSTSPQERFRTSWQSDIYAFSMVVLYMWTGKKPFSDIDDEGQVFIKSSKGLRPKRPSSSTILVSLPEAVNVALWKLLAEMWAQDPAKRPPSEGLLERFKEMFEGSPLPSGTGCTIM